MTERQALIAFFIVMAAIICVVIRSLISLGANADVMTVANALIMCVGGFGVGGIVMRYHR
jgi:hypothetical protein